MCVPCTLWVALRCVYHLRVGAICHVQYAIAVAGKLPADRGARVATYLSRFIVSGTAAATTADVHSSRSRAHCRPIRLMSVRS